MNGAEKARNLRYKKPMLAELGLETIQIQLWEILDACNDVKWCLEGDNGVLESFFDDNEDEEFEFKMAFSTLGAECEQLWELLAKADEIKEYFDDCTVALIGNRYRLLGYDDYEEDYYSLTSYDAHLSHTIAGKRIMRMTKSEMLSTIGQCVGILLAFCNVQYKYEYLKSTLDIIRDENMSVIKTIKEVEEAYENAQKAGFSRLDESFRIFEKLIQELPEKIWIE